MITLKFQIEIFWFVELVNRYLRSDFNFHPNNFTSLIIFIIVSYFKIIKISRRYLLPKMSRPID